jgi:creatinine amidohydrolase/Fe(II)-dependent formamide hydrolase-like protein
MIGNPRWLPALFVLHLCFLPVATTVALAATPSSVELEALTSTEVRDLIGSGKTTIIVPIGGTEQNGPFIALGKHNARVKMLAEKIALALGNALVAPVIAYVPEGSVNPPTAHMRFTGTITVPDAAFDKVVEYAARSFGQHGFRDIVLIGDHGGYQKNLQQIADRLNREWAGNRVRVHAIPEYYRTAETTYADALKAKGFNAEEIGTHAGLADTSLTLALDPHLVRADRLSSERATGHAEGVAGDPRKSTAELGRLGVDAIVEATVAAIKKAVASH